MDPLDGHGYTPLLDALFAGSWKILTMLHAAGADINAKDYRGRLPIHAAVWSGDLQTVKTLVQQASP